MKKKVFQIVELNKSTKKFYAIKLDFPKIKEVSVYLNGLRLIIHEDTDRIKVSPDCRLISGYLFLSPSLADIVDYGDTLKITGIINTEVKVW